MTKPQLTSLGQTTPFCPYCHGDVKKVYGHRDCPHCGQRIHASRRPLDGVYVMLTDREALECEEQWAIKSGRHDEWFQDRLRYEAEASRLADQYGRPPTEREVRHSLLEDEKLKHAKSAFWGVYRNCLYAQAELAWHAKDYPEVISLQSQVAYIDAAGPTNGGLKPFVRSQATIAPGCAGSIAEAAMAMQIRLEEVEPRFMRAAEQVKQSIAVPIEPGQAWKKLVAAIRKQYRIWVKTGKVPRGLLLD